MSGFIPSTDRTISIVPDDATTLQIGYQAFPPRSPGDVLDYTFDWSAWLADDPGDSLVSGSMSFTPSGLTTSTAVNGSGVFVSGATVVFFPYGGIVPTLYFATCTIVTAFGRQSTRTGTLYVLNR
jgi:hypothetical protein